MENTVPIPDAERESAPVVHYDTDTLNLNTACGVRLGSLGHDSYSTDPAAVDCPVCVATLVDGQLAEPDLGTAHEEALNEKRDRERQEWREQSYAESDARRAAPERRTVGLEVLTDELLAEAMLTRDDGNVGVVLRLDGALCSVDKTDEPWVERSPVTKLIDLLRHAETIAASVMDPAQAAELLMPTPDVLAALEGRPVGRFTATVETRWGLVKSGWYVLVETMVDHQQDSVWLLVEDRTECHRPDCTVAKGTSWSCAVTTIRGRGIQHLDAFNPVAVRIPADTEVEW